MRIESSESELYLNYVEASDMAVYQDGNAAIEAALASGMDVDDAANLSGAAAEAAVAVFNGWRAKTFEAEATSTTDESLRQRIAKGAEYLQDSADRARIRAAIRASGLAVDHLEILPDELLQTIADGQQQLLDRLDQAA